MHDFHNEQQTWLVGANCYIYNTDILYLITNLSNETKQLSPYLYVMLFRNFIIIREWVAAKFWDIQGNQSSHNKFSSGVEDFLEI